MLLELFNVRIPNGNKHLWSIIWNTEGQGDLMAHVTHTLGFWLISKASSCVAVQTVLAEAHLSSSSRRWRVLFFNLVCLKGLDRLRAEFDWVALGGCKDAHISESASLHTSAEISFPPHQMRRLRYCSWDETKERESVWTTHYSHFLFCSKPSELPS